MKKTGVIILVYCLVLMIVSSFIEKKPKVLIIGDSISIGYTPYVKQNLADKAIVTHNKGNAMHSGHGLENIADWIEVDDYDIIQFNWGLWDLCYRHPESKIQGNRDKINGELTYTREEYRENLEAIVTILKEKSEAKLLFVTTSYVPPNEAGRYEKDAVLYNKAALKVMRKHSIQICDIYKESKAIHKLYGNDDDNVHYSKKGYEELGILISESLSKMLD